MGWMNNWIYANNLPTPAWRGQMTLPRQMKVVALDPNNPNDPKYRVTSTPVPELDSLRKSDEHLQKTDSFPVPSQTVVPLMENASFSTPLMEVEISVKMQGQPKFSICAYNSLGEESCFGYNGERNWYLDRTKSGNIGFNNEFTQTLYAMAAREVSHEETNIRMFLDVSSIEVFADNGLTAMTALHYPTQPFDKIYINNWSDASDNTASITVNRVNVWGLNCWFEGK